ncbi:MAG TPA: hypothetical protein ENJ64_06670 [Thiotrichales bacterium]|nr:hypothetical protein [Thiotrichales bacterium]
MTDQDKNKPASDKKASAPKKKAAPGKKKTVAKKPTHLVAVKRDGFRRCGRAWSGETEIFSGEFKPEQIKTLTDDPMFTVTKL